MRIQPYLFFNGRADEAIAFYEQTLGARLAMRLRFKDNPDAAAPMPEAQAEKVMHARLEIGESVLLLSDGHSGEGPSFEGFSLTLNATSAEEVDRLFAALSDGGVVVQPPQKTFFSPRFAMAKDRFGVLWVMLVP
jgi:PhnB protein